MFNFKPYAPLERKKEKWGYIFILPWLLLFCVFYAYPLVYGIFVSFTNFTLGKMEIIGLENYKKMFSDYAFWRSVKATFFYAILCLPMQVFLPLWAASTIRTFSRKLENVSKMLIYIPGVICSVAMVIAWRFMLAADTGLVPTMLQALGLAEHVSFFTDAKIAIPVISFLIVITNLGPNTIIYSAALDAIPDTYYEAADLDGATRAQQFWQITFPLVNGTVVYVLITGTIGALQIFVIPQLLTNGGPNYTTSTMLLLIYNSAFLNNQFGYASAIGVILFIITAIIAVIQFRVTQKEAIEY